jgi:protein-disulfide isomerase
MSHTITTSKKLMRHLLTAGIVTSMSLFGISHALAASKSASAMTPTEKTQVETIVHDYILQNPEVLVQAMENLQRKQYEQTQQTIKKTQSIANQYADLLFHNNADPVLGNPNGKITLVEFFDYQCHYCVNMVPIIQSLIKTNPELRVVLKEFPVRGDMSQLASKAALAANLQGKYATYYHDLLNAQQPLTEATIYKLAEKNGIDINKLKTDMNSSAINDELKNNLSLAQKLNVFATPAFFIGKTNTDKTSSEGSIEYILGGVEQRQLQSVINKFS